MQKYCYEEKVAAKLYSLTPPRQKQIWCALKPEYSKERFFILFHKAFWEEFVSQALLIC